MREDMYTTQPWTQTGVRGSSGGNKFTFKELHQGLVAPTDGLCSGYGDLAKRRGSQEIKAPGAGTSLGQSQAWAESQGCAGCDRNIRAYCLV